MFPIFLQTKQRAKKKSLNQFRVSQASNLICSLCFGNKVQLCLKTAIEREAQPSKYTKPISSRCEVYYKYYEKINIYVARTNKIPLKKLLLESVWWTLIFINNADFFLNLLLIKIWNLKSFAQQNSPKLFFLSLETSFQGFPKKSWKILIERWHCEDSEEKELCKSIKDSFLSPGCQNIAIYNTVIRTCIKEKRKIKSPKRGLTTFVKKVYSIICLLSQNSELERFNFGLPAFYNSLMSGSFLNIFHFV